ncbi:hypothetical protein GCM10010912_44180 [Paenibacillus albidus]|uniref:histidine kinase n=1 Tax=Paenibacillus albidus TaxID=2041023 RepID=A0A917CQT1_9BACL|nr:ATP-binding protein [Paenibacillus albidus]GGF94395.1 hypothetical protein GCM10010912_44180 [Paenibacillus albidus]
MIAIIGAIKDILLQISAASFFLFLFQWWLEQNRLTRRNGKFPDDQSFLIIACALSLALCSMLSTTLFDVAYLNLGILPAFIGILYGNFRSGLSLGAFFLFCNLLFSEPAGLSNLLLNSAILLYPLLYSLAAPFKNGTVMEKIGMLWMALFPSMLFIMLVPILNGKNPYQAHSAETLLLTLYLFLTIGLGGALVYVVEMTWDRLQKKEQLKGISEKFQWESEKLQQITNVMPLSVMSLDEDGVITGLNEYMLSSIQHHFPGLTRGDIISQPALPFFGNRLESVSLQKLVHSIETKQRHSEKLVIDTRTYHVYSAPLLNQISGVPGGAVLIVQDTTEEEKLRSELDNVERLTLVGQMAAGITHEIRNPMAVVRGFLQLMQEKSSSELDSYYQIVMEELDRANSIINDFLSLAQSRITDKEEVLLHNIIEDLGPLLWADANLRGQSVELKLPPSLPLLQLNVREIKQLILNLGRNAMEAMGDKGVLTLELRSVPGRVEMTVRDTGSGIPETQRDKLFVPFYTTKSQGTGLGLSLCLSIVERHNGTIQVESEEGKGTTFIISFPCGQEEMGTFALAE